MATKQPMSSAKRATIYDVASAANVSHQTVSRLIKGQSNISPALRVRIEEAIQQLDYRPNLTARRLATQRSNVIGALAAFTPEDFGPSRTMTGVTESARESGYLIDTVNVEPSDKEGIVRALDVFRSRDLAGLLVLAPTDSLMEAVSRIEARVPVHVWHEADDAVRGSTMSLNEAGEEMLVDHLYELGHRRFWFISGPADWISARHRTAGFHAALARRGLSPMGGVAGDWSAASGYSAIRALNDIDFTALVAGNDQMALGATLALVQRGLQIPRDVSVVGFDDIPEARFFLPPLTTVAQDFAQQGRIAIRRLVSKIEGTSAIEALTQAPPVLQIRSSTDRPAVV